MVAPVLQVFQEHIVLTVISNTNYIYCTYLRKCSHVTNKLKFQIVIQIHTVITARKNVAHVTKHYQQILAIGVIEELENTITDAIILIQNFTFHLYVKQVTIFYVIHC
jgi:hypothetical protein